ncbi:hypothetical protein [Micromonospora sp. NPDC002575]|uniref:iron-sulfur cluster-binding protein n=1 Tax=Micromonospora sp. NPDC002575 TaxID=3364222 RepID=UPI0036A06867
MSTVQPSAALAVLPTRDRPMPACDPAVVVGHTLLAPAIVRLVLRAPRVAATAQAGQFVMLSVPESTGELIQLPRPMAVHRRRTSGDIEVVYNVQGRGTEALSRVRTGDSLLVTGPLGRGFDLPATAGPLLAIGRGIGVCSFMTLVEDASAAGIPSTVVLSARTDGRVIGRSDCAELGVEAIAVTDLDGTSTVEGLGRRLVARFADRTPGLVVVCGSHRLTALAMALSSRWRAPLQVSVEAHMACGLGYCHGCALPRPSDPAREGPLVCADGPVFAVRRSPGAPA